MGSATWRAPAPHPYDSQRRRWPRPDDEAHHPVPASNPSGTDRRALDQEASSIRKERKRSGYRDRFEFVTRWAAEPLDLLCELRERELAGGEGDVRADGERARAEGACRCRGAGVVVDAHAAEIEAEPRAEERLKTRIERGAAPLEAVDRRGGRGIDRRTGAGAAGARRTVSGGASSSQAGQAWGWESHAAQALWTPWTGMLALGRAEGSLRRICSEIACASRSRASSTGPTRSEPDRCAPRPQVEIATLDLASSRPVRRVGAVGFVSRIMVAIPLSRPT